MSTTFASNVAGWLRADRRRFDVALAAIVAVIGSTLVIISPDSTELGWPEVASGVGTFVLVLFRRWAPPALLIATMIWIAVHVQVYERPTPLVFAALILLMTTCVRLERWPAIALGTAIAASLYVLGLARNDVEFGDARALIGIAWTAGAVGTADAVRSWRRYRASAEEQIRSATLAAEAQARQQVSDERLTIARELHDLLAHNLAVMNVQAGAAQHLLRSDVDKADEALTAVREAGRSVLDELSDLLSVLRQGGASEPGNGTAPTSSLPTVEALPDLVDTMRSAGLSVEWTQSGTQRELAPAVSLAAYRIVQEALTNAAKHGAGSAELGTTWGDDALTIVVKNPTAADLGSAVGTGHGLVGMRERATVNGGRFETHSTESTFTVEAWLPVVREREAR